MKKLSLDSSFLVDFLRGEERAAEVYRENSERGFILPSVAQFEVKIGDRDTGRIDDLPVVSFGDEEVSEAVSIFEFLQSNGEMINRLDILIAAQAVTSNSKLLTFDDHFSNLEEYDGFEAEICSD